MSTKKGPGVGKHSFLQRTIPPITLRVRIANRIFGAMVDTGAVASIVSSKLVQLIKPAIVKSMETQQQFRVANGAAAAAKACHLVRFTPLTHNSDVTPFVKQQVTCSFYELPGTTYDLLLGRDLIRYLGLIKDYGTPGQNESEMQMAEDLELNVQDRKWAPVSAHHSINYTEDVLATTLDVNGLPTSYMLNRFAHRRLVTYFHVNPTVDCCASYNNTQCAKYIAATPDPHCIGVDFFSFSKLELQDETLWINPLWEDADRVVDWLLRDLDARCECLIFLPLWDDKPWFHSLNAICNNVMCVPRSRGLFVDPMGLPMPPTKYDLICFHVTNYSIMI